MRLAVFQVPYDSGHRGERAGKGPLHLVDRGLIEQLQRKGHDVELVPIHLPEGFSTEVGSAAEIQRLLTRRVSAARADGRLPIVLSGNCNVAVGVLAAVAPGATGVVWLDAHGDFNTPETSTSGFFDGMSLAIATGGCWRALAATVPGFSPVAEQDVVLVGARDLDAEEEHRLDFSRVRRVGIEALRQDGVAAALAHPLEEVASRRPLAYLHIDLDVLDPTEVKANVFSAPGGLSLPEAVEVVLEVGERFELAAVSLTAYDPDHDREDRGPRVVAELVEAVLEAAR